MSQYQSDLTIHIDGAARGNPGPAAYGIVMARDGQDTLEDSGCLGNTTNNVAEYTALVRALEHARHLNARRLLIHSDSELMVKQMNGVYKVKNDQLRKLFEQAQDLVDEFDEVTIRHVRREQNSDADRLCNEALDGFPRDLITGCAPAKNTAAAPAPAKKTRPSLEEAALACLREGGANQPEQLWQELRALLAEYRVKLP